MTKGPAVYKTAGPRSQRYLECYPLSLLFDAYPPALGFNRGFGYGEADAAAPYGAGAGFVGAVEAVEEVREVPLVEALAGVGHLYHGLFAAVEGALSIVRFRAAIKEPVEIVFLFWSLAVGIVIGAGMIPLAVMGSAIIGVILLLFANRKVRSNPYILVLNCADEDAETAVLDVLGKETAGYNVKSKTINASGIELTAELRTKNASTGFVNLVSRLPGVENATLVSYNGEYLA